MFKKLLANLPFNPGLIDQVAFYGRRMKQEASLRRIGFIFITLGFLVQLAAAMYPAQNSLAASTNDILNGITDKNSILRAWDANTGNIRGIYGRFGVTRDNIAATTQVTLSSTFKDYWSIGKKKLSDYGIKGYNDIEINAGGTTVYQRKLHAWDTNGGSSKYVAFQGKNRYGEYFWILQNCGNLTFVGSYLPSLPSPPKAKLSVHKRLLSSATVHPGDSVNFRLEYQNTEPDSQATSFKLTDSLSSNFEFVSLDTPSSRSGNTIYITHGGLLGYSASPQTSTLTVRVKSGVAVSTRICNSASVNSNQSSASSPEQPCVTVVGTTTPTNPPPANPPPSSPPASPSGYCVATTAFTSGSNRNFVLHTSAYVSNATIKGYDYDIDGDGSIDAHDTTSSTPHDKTFSGLGNGTHRISVYVNLAGTNNQTARSSACVAEINIAEDSRVNLSKTVKDITQNIANASGRQVKNGDILEFKLITQNVTGTDYLNYAGQDYFGNVLNYTDIADPSQLTSQGLTLDAQNNLHWISANIKANSSDTKTIRVQVKQSIPSTNNPSAMSPDFNCQIVNSYGNQVAMSVSCPPVKIIAQTANSLPNTGPGTSVIIGGIVAAFAGYLFMRSRILAHELELVRQDYIAAGGL